MLSKKFLVKSISTILFLGFLTSHVFSYDTDNVHPLINTAALKQSNNFLKSLSDFGFNQGIDSIANKKQIYKWFEDGAKQEDSPIIRANNHFHDPTKSWNNAGLDGYVVIPVSPYLYHVTGKSSILWAQDQSNVGFLLGGDWSWAKARSLYYEALTGKDKDIREQKFAYTFRALGQVMHLIADSSVPAHVRNDIHVFPLTIPGLGISVGRPTYESWAKSNYRNLTYTGISVNQSIFNEAVNLSLAKVPISALWDQNKYINNNPDITVGGSIGITEYTNANFFSEDTINSKNYPYPRIDGNTPVVGRTYTSVSGQVYTREYYLKKCCGETKGGEGYLLSAVDLLDYYRQKYPLLSFALPKIPVLDRNVYTDYASFLIPRAVGYSAGLLNYFFRGEMDMVEDPDYFNGYKVKNMSSEDMEGSFELYYDNNTGERKFITSWQGKILANSEGGLIEINSFPQDFPSGKEGECILVFRGKMGNEENAVVGKVPVHIKERIFIYLKSMYVS
ncbi:MAG: hypothetical protein HZC12_03680, partial [Nitrospirae bacterium]|nr:hypothetical protein [Nitrospirota bacterium]